MEFGIRGVVGTGTGVTAESDAKSFSYLTLIKINAIRLSNCHRAADNPPLENLSPLALLLFL